MIDAIGTDIQAAIAAGDFEAALPLIGAYGKALRFAIDSSSDREEKLRLITTASSVIQDRLHLARVIRAQLATRSLEASRLLSYGDMGSTETWRLDG